MPEDARAVANYFLKLADEEKHSLTSMSLLKILYFAHAWHLAENKLPLVAQKFEAWKHGPVNRVVYDQVKKFGKGPVTEKLTVLNLETATFVEAVLQPDSGLKKFLTNIFSYYGRFHAFTLSDITHADGTPWDIVWKQAESGSVPGMWISDDLIQKWFETTGGRLYLGLPQGENV